MWVDKDNPYHYTTVHSGLQGGVPVFVDFAQSSNNLLKIIDK